MLADDTGELSPKSYHPELDENGSSPEYDCLDEVLHSVEDDIHPVGLEEALNFDSTSLDEELNSDSTSLDEVL